MSADAQIEGAMALARSAPVTAPKTAAGAAATKKVAQQFEGVLIAQMLNDMFSGVKTDGMFGGGPGEEMFRSLMIDEYSKQIAAQGGLGLADGVTRELLKHQAVSQ
jgi:Rod binding domain-containing protein